MARIMSEEELQKLRDQAEAAKQQAAAQKELNQASADIDNANNPLRRLEERDEARRQAEHDRNTAARERFAKSHALTAVNDPGRYSPQEVKAARDYLEGQGYGQEGERRRQFNEQQATARHEADMKAQGMERQGQDAAAARANADMKIAETNAASAQKIKDAELAASKELAATEAATKRYGIDAEHGKYNEDGTVTEGSRERTERIKGQSAIDAAHETAKGMIGKAEAQRLQKQEDWEARARIQMGKDAASFTREQLHSMSNIIRQSYANVLTPADREKVTNQLKEQYKNNQLALALIDTMEAPETGATPMPMSRTQGQTAQKPQGGATVEIPKEGAVKQFKEGWQVFRNGRWVPADK